ncbi:MAG: hypothetical protein WA087_03830 [Candidatus Saccharimonadales bacterium]
MGKNKKKRNKVYQGVDAAMTRPVITRVSAVNRSRLGQWWFDRKATMVPMLKIAGVVFVIILIIFEIIQIASGNGI